MFFGESAAKFEVREKAGCNDIILGSIHMMAVDLVGEKAADISIPHYRRIGGVYYSCNTLKFIVYC